MRMNKLIFTTICLVLYLLSYSQDPVLRKNVIANGGNVAFTNNSIISVTLGQNFIGPGAISETFAGIGFWYDLDSITTNIVEIGPSSSSEIWLKQNVPNPFRINSIVDFHIPRRMEVRFVLLNLVGKVFEEYYNETLNEGTYRVQLQGWNLAPGTYFYVLEAAGKRLTKKCIVVQ